MYVLLFYEAPIMPQQPKVKSQALYSRADQALTDLADTIALLPDPRHCEFALYHTGELPLLVRCNVL